MSPIPALMPVTSAGGIAERAWARSGPDEMTHALEAHARHHRIAGWQYLVVSDGDIVIEQCGGVADASRRVAVTPSTTFNAYSITKPFVATAIVQAAHRGALQLDVPISEAARMPSLEGYGTVRDTLVHRAGFPNPLPLRWVHRADEDADFDEDAFVRQHLQSLQPRKPRATRTAYSNLGYLALGRALALADHGTPHDFRGALQRQLLAPLLQESPLHGASLAFGINDAHTHARGHLPRHGWQDLLLWWLTDRRQLIEASSGAARRWTQTRPHQVNGSAYGGLIANARGLATLGLATLGLCPVLPEVVRSQVLAAKAPNVADRTLAWFVGTLRGHPWVAHAGGGLGGYGELRIYPQQRTVSVFLTTAVGLRDHHWLDTLDLTWIGRSQTRFNSCSS